MAVVKVALIGVGMAGRGHAAAYSLLRDRVEVTSVVDVRLDVAERLAKETGAKQSFADYREALRCPETDAVDICAPNQFHEEIAVAAAEAGKHILCEKPIARTLGEADRMIQAARVHSVRFMMAHNWLYFPCNVFLKGLIGQGKLGRVFHARSRIETWRPPLDWRRSRSSVGGGCLINDGVHQFYTLRSLVGDYSGAFGMFDNYAQREMEGEDTATVLLRFRNGAMGEVTTMWACVLPATPRSTPTIELRGEQGTVTAWPWEHRARLYLKGPKLDGLEGWFEPVIRPSQAPGMFMGDAWTASVRDEIADFAKSIVDDEEPPITAQDGRAALAVIVAAYDSAEKHTWVEVP